MCEVLKHAKGKDVSMAWGFRPISKQPGKKLPQRKAFFTGIKEIKGMKSNHSKSKARCFNFKLKTSLSYIPCIPFIPVNCR